MVVENSGFEIVNAPPSRVNLLDEAGKGGDGGYLKPVRIDANETAVIPFTAEAHEVFVHYCEEKELGGYIQCNGADCILCRAGRRKERRLLVPVFLPASSSIGVLSISDSQRVGSLLPQLLPILQAEKHVVLLLSKPDRTKYTVGSVELTEGMEDGAKVITAFREQWDAGQIDLTSVYPKVGNRELAAMPVIATMLRYKGLSGAN